MIRSLTSIVLLLVLSAFLTAQTVSTSTGRGFQISGTVVNALTGQVLADTEVSIGRSRTADTLQSSTTGDDGRFQFNGLAAGKYWLAAQRRGFRRQSFEEHQGFFTGIAVGPGLQSDNLLFRLSPEASISGTVTDDQNDPVREAQVILFHSGVENGTRTTQNREQATTDDRGHYHFSHLQPGKYFVAVSARAWYAQSSGMLDRNVRV